MQEFKGANLIKEDCSNAYIINYLLMFAQLLVMDNKYYSYWLALIILSGICLFWLSWLPNHCRCSFCCEHYTWSTTFNFS